MAEKSIILCDTNIIIEAFRQNEAVEKQLLLIGLENIAVSIITEAELLFGARDKREFMTIKKYLEYIRVVPVTHEICDIFRNIVDNYALSHSTGIPDTFIAATALHHKLNLYTFNIKDFRFIPDLKFYKF